MAGAIDELIAAASEMPAPPASGSEERKRAHERLRKAAKAVQNGAPLSPAELARFVEQTPVCGVTRAAEILGIAPPNFNRYRDRLTEIPVPVAGASAIFVVAEVEELAAELKRGS